MSNEAPSSPHYVMPMTRMELRAEIRAKSKAERNDRMAYLFGKFPDLKETLINQGQKIKVVKNHQYRVYLQRKLLKAYEIEKEKEKEKEGGGGRERPLTREWENGPKKKRIHLQLRNRPLFENTTQPRIGVSNAWDTCVFRPRREEERLQREIIHGTTYQREREGENDEGENDEGGVRGEGEGEGEEEYGNEEDLQGALFSLQRKFSPYCIDIEDDTLADILQIDYIVAAGPRALTLRQIQKLILNFFSFNISKTEAIVLHHRIFRDYR